MGRAPPVRMLPSVVEDAGMQIAVSPAACSREWIQQAHLQTLLGKGNRGFMKIGRVSSSVHENTIEKSHKRRRFLKV